MATQLGFWSLVFGIILRIKDWAISRALSPTPVLGVLSPRTENHMRKNKENQMDLGVPRAPVT